jgi:hypothetical protein
MVPRREPMASIADKREIHYHPNANVYFLVCGTERVRFVDIPGVSSVAQQIASHINHGAIDRRPGAPGQIVGADAVHFLEALHEG